MYDPCACVCLCLCDCVCVCVQAECAEGLCVAGGAYYPATSAMCQSSQACTATVMTCQSVTGYTGVCVDTSYPLPAACAGNYDPYRGVCIQNNATTAAACAVRV